MSAKSDGDSEMWLRVAAGLGDPTGVMAGVPGELDDSSHTAELERARGMVVCDGERVGSPRDVAPLM